MNHGDLIYQTGISHVTPSMTAKYEAPRGKVFVCLLLGTADKKDPGSFDGAGALEDLGWEPYTNSRCAVEAIQYALGRDSGECKDFLRLWNEGEFDILREEWPDAPEAIYIGADSLYQPVEEGAKE